jgi:hypothetical protein
VVLLALAVPIALAALVSQLVTSGERASTRMTARFGTYQPVATVVLAEASGPKGMLSGNRPMCRLQDMSTRARRRAKLGDKAAWQAYRAR